jgi:hypothetical protein
VGNLKSGVSKQTPKLKSRKILMRRPRGKLCCKIWTAETSKATFIRFLCHPHEAAIQAEAFVAKWRVTRLLLAPTFEGSIPRVASRPHPSHVSVISPKQTKGTYLNLRHFQRCVATFSNSSSFKFFAFIFKRVFMRPILQRFCY